MSIHGAVKGALELARKNKALGSSLQSSVIINIQNPTVLATLARYEEELDSMFVISSFEINSQIPESTWSYSQKFTIEGVDGGVEGTVHVLPPKQHKCPRCWRYVAPKEDAPCQRCTDIVGDSL
jgi:isoleucyl-tRNA synthetase